LVSTDFSLGLCFSLAGLKITVKSVIFFINLTLEFFVNLKLSLLVIFKNILEIFGATSISKFILVVS
jgi:hypothetical protein